jgi:hypothetical protein
MNNPDPARVFHMPENADLLAAWARVTIRHSQLDYTLRMVIKSLTGVSLEVARDATAFQGSGELRTRILKLARKRLGEGVPLIQLQALIERCRRLTGRRNDLTHGIVVSDWLGNETTMYPADAPLPTVEELHALANDIATVTGELNTARISGWLAEALRARSIGGNE